MTNHVLVGPTRKKRDLGQHSEPVLVVRPLSLACMDDGDSEGQGVTKERGGGRGAEIHTSAAVCEHSPFTFLSDYFTIRMFEI
jgi:hypothetical protein